MTLKSNGIETTDADTEEELSTSQSTSNLVRPSGPYRSRSGEVLLRENHGRDRTRSNQTVSTSSSTFTSSSQQSHHSQYDSPKESLFSESSRGSPKTISSTSDSANAPGESPSGDGVGRSLRRKASSVDLGNPSAATTPKMQHQSPIQGGHPSTPPQAPKYTLNGFEISSSPFNPAFPPSHRMSSLPPPRHHQPTSGAEDNASPIPVGTPRPGRSGSDSAARDNTRLGLGISPSNSKSQPRQPSKASSLPPGPQDFMETPPNEHDEHALFNTPSSINTSDSSTRRKGPDSTISASSSRSSNLLDSPEVERRYNRHAQSASSLNKERDIQRPAPIKVAEGSGKQSPADASKAGSALSPGLPPTPTTQQESSMPMSTLKNFKLDPTHLGLCKIRVTSSQIRMNDKAREVILFFITVSLPLASSSNPDASSSLVHWTVEKYFSDFIQLDTTVKSKHGKNITKKIASLPDKSLFKDHAPSKVDTRKVS